MENKDVQMQVDIAVLSDQTKRVGKQLLSIEEKLDEFSERIAKIETAMDHTVKSNDRWMGWAAAGGLLIIELAFRFVKI